MIQTEKKADISKLSDLEILVLTIERDTAQFKMERIDELLNEYGKAKGFVEAEREQRPAAVKEETFLFLKFEPQKGEQLGEYEVAYKANNLPDKWNQAFNILRQGNATISSRYHGADYQFSYWLYGEDKIHRQKLKPNT